MPLSDSAICFARNTHYTYPLMSQLYNAIQSYARLRDCAMDLHELRGHTLRVFNELNNLLSLQQVVLPKKVNLVIQNLYYQDTLG